MTPIRQWQYGFHDTVHIAHGHVVAYSVRHRAMAGVGFAGNPVWCRSCLWHGLQLKFYRVGIFMHGKKPTIKDLVRWARYK